VLDLSVPEVINWMNQHLMNESTKLGLSFGSPRSTNCQSQLRELNPRNGTSERAERGFARKSSIFGEAGIRLPIAANRLSE
jgi:hypothetical protein